jgi:hypothetical protein
MIRITYRQGKSMTTDLDVEVISQQGDMLDYLVWKH